MGLLDIWNDWRKESGYGETESTIHPLAQKRSDLSTAGGTSADMDKRIPRKRGEFETPSKYIREKKEVRDRLGRVVQQGSPVQSSNFQTRFTGKKNGQWMGPGQTESAAKTPNTVYQDQIMKGGTGINQDNTDPRWWHKLGNMANVDIDKPMATWKDKGGFEGLMANPAFTMGLAFMQAGAEGKTLGQGALDNVMKAAGISSHYKQIIKDRKQVPIQATAQDVYEVKGLLKSIGIEEGNIFEKVWSKVTGQGNQQVKFDLAAHEIAVQLQKEVRDWQANNKYPDGTPKIIRPDDKIIILQKLIKNKKVKYKKSIFDRIGISSTIEKDIPKITNYAQGGQIQKGQPAIVGEGGPEYFLPQESGKILSNDDSQIYAMLLASNPQLQKISRARAERILRTRFPEYFE